MKHLLWTAFLLVALTSSAIAKPTVCTPESKVRYDMARVVPDSPLIAIDEKYFTDFLRRLNAIPVPTDFKADKALVFEVPTKIEVILFSKSCFLAMVSITKPQFISAMGAGPFF